MKNLVSSATTRNWYRLSSSQEGRLISRANKKQSQKQFIPIEYLTNKTNISKIEELVSYIQKNNYEIGTAMYNLGLNLLKRKNLLHKKHVKQVLTEFHFPILDDLVNYDLKAYDETDLLGLMYQSLLTEGEKNTNGSYYTPFNIVKDMTRGLSFSKKETILDPCCGTGSFFLGLEDINPSQIFGIERSYIPYMLTKINLILKFPKKTFIPNIFNYDFFEVIENIHSSQTDIKENSRFNYIITNPPWGGTISDKYSYSALNSKESSALFFVYSFGLLKDKGTIRFLFPEAILNIKKHSNLRLFMLQNGNLNSITLYDNLFSGVTTKFANIELINETSKPELTFIMNNQTNRVKKSVFLETENNAFRLILEDNRAIIKKIESLGKYYLDNSIWALGIVTGDNKNKLKDAPFQNSEKIYTGKEIESFRLKPPKKYIFYNRNILQQAAKEEIYRAQEKLVYKFISSKLVFAYDNSGSLFLNSANILIPDIPNMSTKTVLGFLNSNVFRYYYKQLFGEVKILKGNLMKIPFPKISSELNKEIGEIVTQIIAGDDAKIDILQKKIYQIYSFGKKEQSIIEGEI